MKRPLRVLFVEDSELDAELMLERLRGDFSVERHETVCTAEDFTKVMGQGWDIVLSDYAMPRFDGLEAYRLLREADLEVPFILVSGHIGEERAVEAIRAGVQDFVDKNQTSRLADAVRRALREAEARRRAREAEDAFAQEAHRNEAILESLTVGVWELDARGAWDALCADRSNGVPLDQAIASAAARVVTVHTNDAARGMIRSASRGSQLRRVWTRLLLDFMAGERHVQFTEAMVTAEGSVHLTISARLPKQVDDLSRLIVTMVDVSKQRRLERALHASQRMEAIGQLITGMANDFNEVLGLIGTYARRMEAAAIDDNVRVDATATVEAVERGTAMIQQLMAFSRRQPQTLEQVALNDVVSKTRRLLSSVLGEDIDLVCELNDKVLDVRMDRTQLDQILMNLLVNARDAMPYGGRIVIGTDHLDVRDPIPDPAGFTIAPGRYTVLSVRDTGTGIRPEVMRRMFEPFYTTKDDASGMGLATIYGIVKQSNGYVSVDSVPRKGTTMRIILPVARRSDVPMESGVVVARVPAGETVLIVDPDSLSREITLGALGQCRLNVLVATTVEEARALANEHQEDIDVIVTDVVLPGANGLQLSRELRRACPRAGFVVTSRFRPTGPIADALTREHAMFVQKPISPKDILSGVLHALRARDRRVA